MVRGMVAAGCLIAVLGCGGALPVGAGSDRGETVGTFATNYAKWQDEKFEGKTPRTYRMGTEWEMDDGNWTVRVDKVTIMEAEHELPWIRAVTERNWMKGKTLIMVDWSLRNNQPVPEVDNLRGGLYLTDGELSSGGPSNTLLYLKERGLQNMDHQKHPPGVWVEHAWSGDTTDPALVEGAVVLFLIKKPQFDKDRRKEVQVRTDTVLVELTGAVRGPHVNPEKR